MVELCGSRGLLGLPCVRFRDGPYHGRLDTIMGTSSMPAGCSTVGVCCGLGSQVTPRFCLVHRHLRLVTGKHFQDTTHTLVELWSKQSKVFLQVIAFESAPSHLRDQHKSAKARHFAGQNGCFS